MSTSNNSIKAIIFTIILFLFIIFISLFKGIHLYNIHIKNISIKHLFIKINHKIVLKIYDINIKNNKKYIKQAIKLNQTILLATKFLNIFEEIYIKFLHYSTFNIKNLSLKNKILTINSDILKSKAVLNTNLSNTFINFNYIYLPKYHLKFNNALFNIKFKKDKVLIIGSSNFNKKTINYFFSLYSDNNLNLSLYSKKIVYKKFYFKNIKIKGNLNLDYFNFKVKGFIKYADIWYKNYHIIMNNSNLNIKNNKIKLESKQIKAANIPKLKILQFYNLTASYDLNTKYLIATCKNINTQFNKYVISSINNNLIYKQLNNFTFNNEKIIIKNKDLNIKLNNNLLTFLNNYKSLTINNAKVSNNDINLSSTQITSNLNKIFTKTVKGKVYGYDTKIDDINVNIKSKSAKIKNIIFNNIKIFDISYKDNNITLHSNTSLNKDLKELLNRFLDIDVPITQLKGNNYIITNIYIKPKIDTLTKIYTVNSTFKIKDLNLTVPKADINITNKNLTFNTKNAKFYLTDTLPLKYSGKGLMEFKKEYLYLNGLIDFNLSDLIDLKNFKETVFIDFKHNFIKTENSKLFYDLSKNYLIINPLKNILRYSIFKPYINNGILMMNIKNSIDIITYLSLKLKPFVKHNNNPISKKITPISKIYLTLQIFKDFINVFNDNLSFTIKKDNYFTYLHDIDIDLTPLETLLEKNSSTTTNDMNITFSTKNVNFIYKKHKFLSSKASVIYKNNNINFQSFYKNSSINGYTKQKYILLEGKNFTNDELIPLLPSFNFLKKINFDFVLVKSPDNFYTGKIYINNGIVSHLAALNNIIAFINTIPSLLSFSSPGFSSKGFKIKNGFINYLLYKNVLYIKQANIEGNNLSFFVKGYINLNKQYIFLKITANMKMKIKKIPIIGKGLSYLLFGKDGSIDIHLLVKGDLNNPKVEKDIGKEILMTPFKLIKRAVTLPFNLF